MKKRFLNVLMLSSALLWLSSYASAQSSASLIDKINKKIERFSIEHPSSVLFCHFDKNIYTPNEDVWFTSYLLNYNKQTNNPSILTALLVKKDDRSIVIERHFAMSGGLSFGHVIIPENTTPGEYVFLTYTNVAIKGTRPLNFFTQPVTIKSATRPGFLFTVKDTVNKSGKGFIALVTKKDGNPAPHAFVAMTVDTIHFRGETDHYGKYITPILPKLTGKFSTYTEITFASETFTKRTRFHDRQITYKVNFYPEGGDLVDATPCTIGWEVKKQDGNPVKIKALLLRNNAPIDTIETDDYGIGRFRLVPASGSIYKVKLLGVDSDTACMLPKIYPTGPGISINRAVCNDSLRLRITSQHPAKYFVFIHDYTHSYFAFPVETDRTGKAILINLQTIPKGLCAVTIADSIGRPWAERLFFAHFDQKASSQIQTDLSTYKCRQKVNVRLRFSADDSEDTAGVVSIACVESNRLDPTRTSDISTYTYLTDELAAMPFRKNYLSQTGDSKSFLENMLLVKGWRRFTWQDIIDTHENDSSFRPDLITAFDGSVTHSGHLLNKSANLLLTTDSLTRIIRTDESGRFTLNESLLTNQEGQLIHMRVSSGSGDVIKIQDPFVDINHYLIDHLDINTFTSDQGEDTSDSGFISDGLKNIIALKEVVVKGKSTVKASGAGYGAGANSCGDYICSENVLNCPVHASEAEKMPAVKGGVYGIMTSHHGDDVFPPLINGNYAKIGSFRNYENDSYDVVRYLGCKLPENSIDTVAFAGVLYSKEFYPINYSNSDKPLIDTRSTIFWNKLCLVSTKHDTDLSFFTSDVTGKFKIVIQGLVGKKRIYSEKEILVSQ